MVLSTSTAFAVEKTSSSSLEILPDGSYFETVIEDIPSGNIQTRSTTTVTKSKTSYYKNAEGTTLWYVRVTGTFTYGNGSSRCTSDTPYAVSQASMWKVSNISGSHSENHASATATGKRYFDGSVVESITKTVTLTCSPTGVFS